jgi:YVTN family beta-propeller protein
LDRAYITDLTDGTVAVINTLNHQIVEMINVGSPVATVDVADNDRLVYVLDFSNGTPGTNMHIIDADMNAQISDVPVGTRLQNIALDSGADRAYLTDFVAGVIEIDTTDNTVAATLPVANLPHGIAVNPATNRLYITRLENNSVTVIDTTTLTEITTLPVGDTPQWIALDIPRGKAFVTNEMDGTVSVIDINSHTVLPGAIPVGLNPLTVTVHSGAAKAYVYNIGDGTVSVIDTIGNNIIATLNMEVNMAVPALNPLGAILVSLFLGGFTFLFIRRKKPLDS